MAEIGKAIRILGEGTLELTGNLIGELEVAHNENEQLHAHIAELERSHALDSTNGSKPPSSDGPGRKKRKRTQSQRTRTGKPSGGQPGHDGVSLKQIPDPDHIVDHDPTVCSGCGGPLSEADRQKKHASRQVFDLPEPRPLEVTEHRAHNRRRPSCATTTRAAFPEDVRGPVQYGPRITALVTYLLHAQFILEKRLRQLMRDRFGVRTSTATIAAMARRTADCFGPFVEQVTELLRGALVPVKHLDETTIRINGEQHWIHVLCSQMFSVLRIGTRRGDVGEGFVGILVHDAFSPYYRIKG